MYAIRSYYVKWTQQGVLLLNTVLTVRAHEANSHKSQGWENFTDKVIETVNRKEEPVVFLLWGSHAQKKAELITNPRHMIIRSPHPSPLSAHRGVITSYSIHYTKLYDVPFQDRRQRIVIILRKPDID